MPSAARRSTTAPNRQVNRGFQARHLIAFSSVAVALVSSFIVFWRSGAPRCPPAPDAMTTVYCGVDLAAFASGDGNVIQVVNSKWSPDERADHIVQTWIDLSDGSTLQYIEAIAQAVIEDATSPNVLLLGLGGGSLPFLLSKSTINYTLTAVDISNDALEITRRFVVPDDGVRVRYVCDNAFAFLADAPSDAFDIVISDVYIGSKSGIGRTSAMTFFAEAYRVLKSTGATFIMNCFDMGNALDRSNAVADTLRTVFDDVALYQVDDELDSNILLLAWKGDHDDEEQPRAAAAHPEKDPAT
ncbi:unnamed protein product (mitochondrion) [Plasmodiophora brassicae]|uniref:Methyltransferase domain-containing protein n=1 Tax=Plasmodiophora brassicae TaxID=37360 RepID=A0A0G4IW77_PLABS|nr:hypothetical protein PBRA_001290 [Plasmodiophora brassicae]SPQ97388.1 unnamed protein product [Plasmodiophora brassicae]